MFSGAYVYNFFMLTPGNGLLVTDKEKKHWTDAEIIKDY